MSLKTVMDRFFVYTKYPMEGSAMYFGKHLVFFFFFFTNVTTTYSKNLKHYMPDPLSVWILSGYLTHQTL